MCHLVEFSQALGGKNNPGAVAGRTKFSNSHGTLPLREIDLPRIPRLRTLEHVERRPPGGRFPLQYEIIKPAFLEGPTGECSVQRCK